MSLVLLRLWGCFKCTFFKTPPTFTNCASFLFRFLSAIVLMLFPFRSGLPAPST